MYLQSALVKQVLFGTATHSWMVIKCAAERSNAPLFYAAPSSHAIRSRSRASTTRGRKRCAQSRYARSWGWSLGGQMPARCAAGGLRKNGGIVFRWRRWL